MPKATFDTDAIAPVAHAPIAAVPVAVERDSAPVAPKVAPVAPKPVTRLRMASMYGYYAEDGLLRSWPEGAVVSDAAEVADLLARKAPVTELKD